MSNRNRRIQRTGWPSAAITSKTPLPLRERLGEGSAHHCIELTTFGRRNKLPSGRPSPNPSLKGRGIRIAVWRLIRIALAILAASAPIACRRAEPVNPPQSTTEPSPQPPPAAPPEARPPSPPPPPVAPVPQPTPKEHQQLGDAALKAGRFVEAIAHFDQYLAAHPEHEPHHWQRGIAYYYAGQFEKGVGQFERHRTVNPADVENAVWHFICNAKLVGVANAQKAILPVGDDQRLPMMKIYDMFAGSASPDDVLEQAQDPALARRQAEPARFYAHLYIALYHEACNDLGRARHHMTLAAEKHTRPYYMGDLAKMHAGLLRAPNPETNAADDDRTSP